MPSATFVADFSQFQSAVNSAAATLKGFEGESDKVAQSLEAMGESTKEASLSAKTLAAGVQDIDLNTYAEETHGAAQATGTFGEALGESDRVLNLVGIHTGPVGKALEELGAISGKTASQVGLIGTAGLAVGAAIVGWNIGRAIAEFFDLDNAIAETTARLLGLGDVMAETAGAKADALARASQLVGLNITEMGDAVRLTTEHLERSKTAFNTFNDEILRTRAPEITAERVAKLNEELVRLRQAGLSDDLAADIKSHNFSLKELSDLYRVSEAALNLFSRQLETSDRLHAQNQEHLERAAEAMRKWKEEQEKAAAAQHKMLDTIERGDQITTGFTAKVVSLGDALLAMGTHAQVSVHDIDAFVEAQERAQKALDAEFAASFEAAKAQDAFNAQVAEAPPVLNETSESMLRMTQIMMATAAGAYTFTSAFNQATTAADAYARAISAGNLNATPGPMIINPGGSVGPLAPGSRMPSFQSGGSVGQTGMAYLHAGEYVVPKGGMGGGMNVTINVTQPLGTPEAIARAVDDAILRRYMSGGARLPFGG